MKNRRVFVSGGAGVIGSALVNKLLEEGAEILVGDLKQCPGEWAGRLRYWQGDLNEIQEAELALFNPELFFHLAAAFERSEESPSFIHENFHHNVALSHGLLKKLSSCTSLRRVVFASSYLVYDPSLYFNLTPSSTPVSVLDEESPLSPRNLCGSAKLFHEQELAFSSRFFSFSSVSARIFRVYGKGSRDIVSRWVRAALKGEVLEVYCKEGRFDYIFSEDVAEGLLRLALSQERGVVNLGSGVAISIEELLNLLRSHFPDLKSIEQKSTLPVEASQASIVKLKRITGWQPPCSLVSGIEQLIQWEKQQPLIQKTKRREHAGVLITSISKKVPLIQAVRRAAHKIGAFCTIHGADSSQECLGLYEVDHFWHMPPQSQLLPEDVLDYCTRHGIGAIIPTRDGELLFFATHRSLFEEHGIKIMVGEREVVDTTLDKKRFADVLNHHQLGAIPTALSLDELPAGEFFVVKERRGSGSRGMAIRVDRELALAAAREMAEPIFQPWIEGREWSVDLYQTQPQKMKGIVSRQRNVVERGESQVTTTAFFRGLEELCEAAAHVLRVEYHSVFQVIVDKTETFHLIECNPRFGGASTASIAVGLDSFFWFFAACLDINHDEESMPFLRSPYNVLQVRTPHDTLFHNQVC